MRGEWLRAFGFFFVVAFLGLVAYAVLPKLLGVASGPEGEILTLIKSEESKGLQFPIPGRSSPLRSTTAYFDRITITVAPDGKSAEAVATLDFNGVLHETRVSSLGYEKLRFVRTGFSWEVLGSYAPRLSRIVKALEARRMGLESGDLARLNIPTDASVPEELAQLLALGDRRYEARAWYIRTDRDEVLVTEDATLKGKSPDRPIHEERTRRLSLRPTASGEFFFPQGLL